MLLYTSILTSRFYKEELKLIKCKIYLNYFKKVKGYLDIGHYSEGLVNIILTN